MEPEKKPKYHQNCSLPLLEKQWVRKVREEGERSAFEKIFRMYYKQLIGFAYTFMQCREQAEDIVQTVFLRIWSNKKTWDPPGKVKSYLFTAVRNEALNEIRHKQIEKESENKIIEIFRELKSSTYNEQETDLENLRKTILKEVDRLPVCCKEIFLLHRRSGLTYSEIAEYLNISINTVNTQMGRALKMLRKNLSDYAPL